MRIPLVDLKAQYAGIKDDIDAAMQAVIEATAFVGGPFLEDFEKAFAEYCEIDHAVGCANGTDAIELALRALGTSRGDEVVVPAHTFYATPESVVNAGGVPVFCDVEANGFTMDPASFRQKITERTRFVIPVHLYGHACDMDPIREIATARGITVVEDCAQAHGARYKGKRIGTFGSVATFSFFPGKNLGAYGDAGGLVTGDAELARRLRMLRNHGREKKYEHDTLGVSSRLDGLQASILSAKLRHLEGWNAQRRRIAARYTELLDPANDIEVPRVRATNEPVWHLYVVRVPGRDRVLARMHDSGIGCGVHYPLPCHEQPAFRGGPRLPRTESLAPEILSLPIYPEMTDAQVRFVADKLTEVVGGHAPAELGAQA